MELLLRSHRTATPRARRAPQLRVLACPARPLMVHHMRYA